MNAFFSKNKGLTEGNRPPSPLARLTRGRKTRKENRDRFRQSSDSVLDDVSCSESANSSPTRSPLCGRSNSLFSRSHSLPLFKSRTGRRYSHIFGKDFIRHPATSEYNYCKDLFSVVLNVSRIMASPSRSLRPNFDDAYKFVYSGLHLKVYRLTPKLRFRQEIC